MKHNKRYMITIQEWGMKDSGFYKNASKEKFFTSQDIEVDTINEVNTWIDEINEYYSSPVIERPDYDAKEKYEKIVEKQGKFETSITQENWTYDETHFFWGYVVMDFEEEKCIKYGGVSILNYIKPLKNLALKDHYFRGDNEIPKDYVWDGKEEYQGWLKFRWGDGSNAIDKYRARKAKEEEHRQKEYANKLKERQEEEEYLKEFIDEE